MMIIGKKTVFNLSQKQKKAFILLLTVLNNYELLSLGWMFSMLLSTEFITFKKIEIGPVGNFIVSTL